MAATQMGDALAQLEPRLAASLSGVIYTTALPETFRAAHGIFYTPPELADRLIVMAEDAGVDWKTQRILDPACGGGAFLMPMALRNGRNAQGIKCKLHSAADRRQASRLRTRSVRRMACASFH